MLVIPGIVYSIQKIQTVAKQSTVSVLVVQESAVLSNKHGMKL